MILSKLDVPIEIPHVMAFSVDALHLEHTRQALQKVITKNDWLELHQIGVGNRAYLETEVLSSVYQIDSSWLNSIINDLIKAAEILNIKFDYPVEKIKGPHYVMRPWALYSLLQTCEIPGSILSSREDFSDQGLNLIYSNRLGTLAQAIYKSEDVERPDYQSPGPLDASISEVKIPDWPYSEKPTAEDLIQFADGYISAQLDSYHLFERLVGPFVQSSGPGPFLDFPPSAKTVFDTNWPKHSLFQSYNVPIERPLQFLAGEDINAALNWIAEQKPNLNSFSDLSKKQKNSLVSEYSVALVDRFKTLLEAAIKNKKAVLLMENDLSHPFWFGGQWPRKASPSDIIF